MFAVDMIGRNEGGDEFLHFIRLGIRFFVQFFQTFPKEDFVQRNGFCYGNKSVRGFLHPFFVHEPFFVKFFAGTKTGTYDIHIHARFIPGKFDQVDGKVVDPDGFAHIENEDLPFLCVTSRLQNEGNGFGNGHEITDDVFMGHGNGTPFLDLFFEQGDHGTVGTEYVAESYGDEFRVFAVFADGLNDHLADPLRRPHDVRRVNGFVGGDLNEGLNLIFVGAVGDVQRAEHVVFHRFARACFH